MSRGPFQLLLAAVAFLGITPSVLAAPLSFPQVDNTPARNILMPPATGETLPEPPRGDYTLGTGDIVQIDIFRVPQYSGERQVLVDGTLNLPLVGAIDVRGLTLPEAAARLSEAYGEFLRRPIITVNLSSTRPVQIAIAGEVNSPGAYAIAAQGTVLPRLTQLLETAGGTTQTADIRQVLVYRRQQDGTYQTLEANLWQLIRSGDQAQNLTLRDGDSIFVPTAMVPLEESALLADASFASNVNQPINIAIIGEVYRPGPYTLQGGQARTGNAGTPGSSGGGSGATTVTRALQVAGGIKPQADIRSVQVSRATRAGAPQVFEVDLWQLLQSGNLQQDAILQEGDTVFVPAATALNPEEVPELAAASFSPDSIRVNIVGETERTGTLELEPNTALSQAVLAAGGFNNRANEAEAELIRLNPDGTVTRRIISVDFDEGINEESNPLLRNNDVVVVNPSFLADVDDTVGSILGPVSRVIQSIFLPLRLLNVLD
ncbi:SLBB domain-containing protein [cf. Phormidesmis sp. LEGE 11477]|uniref:SLBB domain-containing protein n=1 Tax=cf. Phormidesmis sp. LEGE 11477 TaxID=1828680 RepID=UPI00351CF68D